MGVTTGTIRLASQGIEGGETVKGYSERGEGVISSGWVDHVADLAGPHSAPRFDSSVRTAGELMSQDSSSSEPPCRPAAWVASA